MATRRIQRDPLVAAECDALAALVRTLGRHAATLPVPVRAAYGWTVAALTEPAAADAVARELAALRRRRGEAR